MQSFPSVIDSFDLEDMGHRELSALVEKLTERVTALEKKRTSAPAAQSKWRLSPITLAVVAILIAVAAWIEPRISSHLSDDAKNGIKIEVAEQLKDQTKQITEIAGDVREIKGKLEVLAPLIQKLTVQHIGEVNNLTPEDLVARLPELKQLATIAKTANITVKPEAVEQLGTKLIAMGGSNAWETAIDFLNYKSFLNTTLTVKYRQVGTPGDVIRTRYEIESAFGSPQPQFSVLGAVPSNEAAKVQKIGSPDLNASSDRGNDWIIADGGGVTIDNMRLKKVIFRNVHISYGGGPLEVEDVYFLNCTFDVKQKPNGQALVAAALKPSPSTTFKAS